MVNDSAALEAGLATIVRLSRRFIRIVVLAAQKSPNDGDRAADGPVCGIVVGIGAVRRRRGYGVRLCLAMPNALADAVDHVGEKGFEDARSSESRLAIRTSRSPRGASEPR